MDYKSLSLERWLLVCVAFVRLLRHSLLCLSHACKIRWCFLLTCRWTISCLMSNIVRQYLQGYISCTHFLFGCGRTAIRREGSRPLKSIPMLLSLLFFLVKALRPLTERNSLGSTFPLQLETSVVFVQRILGPELNVSDTGIS